MNKSFDEKDKLLQELESRFVGPRKSDQLKISPKVPTKRLVRRSGEYRNRSSRSLIKTFTRLSENRPIYRCFLITIKATATIFILSAEQINARAFLVS